MVVDIHNDHDVLDIFYVLDFLDVLDMLDVLTKSPSLYEVQELRYLVNLTLKFFIFLLITPPPLVNR